MPLIATRGAASAQGFGEFAQSAGPVYIEDVFSTWLYAGNGTSQTITNGIDLSGKGGLVWIKDRTNAINNVLFDTARGVGNGPLLSDSTAAGGVYAQTLTAFNSNGFSVTVPGSGSLVAATNRNNPDNYVSWTFREQPKFFDVVTYTGNNSSQTINHNLGSVPGCIIVKCVGGADPWFVYHRSLGTSQYLILNSTDGSQSSSGFWGSVTSTSFGTTAALNANGLQYVAYLFAHDAGGFGLSGTDNVITCGSYTGTGGANTVTLGYEPQWLLVKKTNVQDSTSFWSINDNMRGGLNANGNASQLKPNSTEAEDNLGGVTTLPAATATGFTIGNAGGYNASGAAYIYIAIRRGPMKTPTSGTSVFSPVVVAQTDIQQTSGGTFPPDFVFASSRNGSNRVYVNQIADRLRGLGTPSDTFSTTTDGVTLVTSSTAVEDVSNSYIQLKANSIDITRGGGWNSATFGNFVYYLMRRAPGFFDEVCYAGTGGSTTLVNHNLGAVPELIITKRRNGVYDWVVYSQALGTTKVLFLNTVDAQTTFTGVGNITSTSFETYSVLQNGTQVAYLFASIPGVSKVGSYTGTGTTQVINCGFTAGSRFVMIKRTDSTGDWYFWDSARGIVAGNDPYSLFNTDAVEVTNTDFIDTAATGFEISSTAPAAINANGGTFIFLAIA
jgi:hypothetical protein